MLRVVLNRAIWFADLDPVSSEASIKVRDEAWSGGDTAIARNLARPMVRFLAQETASGVLLLLATAAALIWVVVGVGLASMLLGGYRALRPTELKLLPAPGTVSQLGFMIVLSGLRRRMPATAVVAGNAAA